MKVLDKFWSLGNHVSSSAGLLAALWTTFFLSLPKVYPLPLVQNVLYLHMPNFGSYKAQLVITSSIKPSRALKCMNFPFTKPLLSLSLDLCVLPGRAGMSTPHPHSNLAQSLTFDRDQKIVVKQYSFSRNWPHYPSAGIQGTLANYRVWLLRVCGF